MDLAAAAQQIQATEPLVVSEPGPSWCVPNCLDIWCDSEFLNVR